MIRSLFCIGLIGLLATDVVRAQTSVTISINAQADRHPISPYIYGASWMSSSSIAELNFTMNRAGGEVESGYNWRDNAHNMCKDWYWISMSDYPEGTPPAAETRDHILKTRSAPGGEPAITVPMQDWQPKLGPNRSSTWSYSIAKYGPQNSHEPWNADAGDGIGTNTATHASWEIRTNNPTDAYFLTNSLFQRAFIQTLTNNWGCSTNGGVRHYIMDNEYDIWDFVHRDIYPNEVTKELVLEKLLDYASRVKAVDPNAKTWAPEEWGFLAYSYIPWLLDKLRQYEADTGVRLLDICTVHYYASAGGENATNITEQLARNVSTRGLWDTNWVDPAISWWSQPMSIIPNLKKWVRENYPGTQIGITEYNWGARNHINGAIAQADVLGIFGREGLDVATFWGDAQNEPATLLFKAMKMYRNYDGSRSTFGDISIQANVPNPDVLSSFAAVRTNDGALTVMVLNKDLTNSSLVTFSLSNFVHSGAAQVWQLTAANAITRLSDLAFTGNNPTSTVPKESITLFVFSAGAPLVCGAASAPSPANAATGVSTLPALSWTAGSNAITHEIYLGTSSNAVFAATTNSPEFKGSVAVTSFTPATLAGSTVHYWRVDERANAGAAAGPVWRLTTANAPVAPAGLAANNIWDRDARLSWNTVSGATTYNLKRATSPAGPFVTVTNTTALAATVAGMTGGTTYYFAVSALNASGESTNSAPLAVTTRVNLARASTAYSSSVQSGNTPDEAIDGDTGTRWESAFSDPQWITLDFGSVCSPNAYRLNWEYASSKAFQVQVSADSNSWTTVYNTTTGPGGVQAITNPAAASGRYVRMYGTSRNTTYGHSLWEFEVYGTSGAPLVSIAQNPSPADGGINVSLNSELGWFAGTNALLHRVYFGATSNAVALATTNSPEYKGTSPFREYIPGTMLFSTAYYWRVDEVNGTTVTTGPVWSFTTAPPLLPPDGLTGCPWDHEIELSWNPAVGATSYNLKRGTSAAGPFNLVANISGTAFVDTNLTMGATYYYVLSSKEGATETTNSLPVAITTRINLALNKTATASSTVAGNLATNAVDGKESTRWESSYSDPQWIRVDLGANYTLDAVRISWEYARSKAYQIQVSTNASTWVDIYSTANSQSGVEFHTNLPLANLPGAVARHIRIYGTQRSTVYGHSIYELEVYGNPPPAIFAPSSFRITSVSSNQIGLAWQDNSSNETGFRIERKQGSSGTYALLTTVGAGVTNYNDTGLPPRTTYYYRVLAYNASTNSAFSGETNATTTPSVNAPTALAAGAVATNRINLSWADNSHNETGFHIERSQSSGGGFAWITTTAAGATNFSDTGLAANTTYYYRVVATNNSDFSLLSNQAFDTTFSVPGSMVTPTFEFQKRKYGLFVHYVYGGIYPYMGDYTALGYQQGYPTNIDQLVGTFNVTNFANQVSSMGVEYLILTAYHANMNVLFPSTNMAKWRGPGHATTSRDLLGEVCDAMNGKGIKVLFYIHIDIGQDFSPEDKIATGYTNTDRTTWNSFMNEIVGEIGDRYGNRIEGFWCDGAYINSTALNGIKTAMRRTNPNLIVIGNNAQSFGEYDLGCKEAGSIASGEYSMLPDAPPGYPVVETNVNTWLSYDRQIALIAGGGWWSSNWETNSMRYKVDDLVKYTALQAGANTHGGGVAWSAGCFGHGSFDPDFFNKMTAAWNLMKPFAISITNTLPSTSFITPKLASIERLSGGFTATMSTDRRYDYIHVLRPPAGNTLQLPVPADGRTFNSAMVLVNSNVVTLVTNAYGYALTLPAGQNWDPRDTVIRLTADLPLPVTLALSPAADTRILNDGNPTNFVGATDTMGVYQGRDRTFLRFDLASIPSNAVIQSATLTIYANTTFGSNPSLNPLEVYRVARSWNEYASSWNYYNGAGNNWSNPGGDAVGTNNVQLTEPFSVNNSNPGANQPVNWDIKNLVSAWLNNTFTNHGFMVRQGGSANGGLHFWSREKTDAGLRPKLSIIYRIPSVPPAAPSSLVATTMATNQINLTWSDNSPDESGFQVERSLTSGGGFVIVGATAAGVNNFSDVGLAANTLYYYRVAATNGAGVSGPSAEASATTFPFPPSAPASLSAVAISGTQINLTWSDTATNETGFKLQRKVGAGGTYAQVATPGANSSSYADSGLAGNTTYYYRLCATNAGGDSAFSNETNATTMLVYGSISLTNSDAYGSSSFNAKLNWDDVNAPNAANDYYTANFTLRTPNSTANVTFLGHSLTLNTNATGTPGNLTLKSSGSGYTVTITNLILAGGVLNQGQNTSTNNTTTFNLNGDSLLVAADSTLISTPNSGETRALVVNSPITGSRNLLVINDGTSGTFAISLWGNNSGYHGTLVLGSTVNPAVELKLNLTNSMSLGTGPVLLGAGNITLENTSGSTISLTNPVSGTGGFSKAGSAALALSGTNTYTGATVVKEGALLVNGSIGNTVVTVSNGATLGGTGAMAGPATVNGTFSPGNGSIGALSISNALTLAGTAWFELNKSLSPSNDTATVGGTLTAGGTLIVTNLGGSLTSGDTFRLFSKPVTQSFDNLTWPDLPPGLSWTNRLAVDGSIAVVLSSTGPAVNPNPTNGAVDVALAPTLTWTAGLNALSHQIYFGANSNSIATATTNSPEFKGTQTATNYAPGALASSGRFYWRVDEVGASSSTNGVIWTFATLVNPDGKPQIAGSYNGSFAVSFPSQIGQTYRVEGTDSLSPANWHTVSNNIPGTGGTIQIPDSGAAGVPQRFYRVVILSP